MSNALIWCGLAAETVIVSPPRVSQIFPYSRSGSMMRISAFGSDRYRLIASCLASRDLPEPETPQIKAFPFCSSARLTVIRFLLMALLAK